MEAAELPLEQLPRRSKRPKIYPVHEYKPVDVPLADLLDANGVLHLDSDVQAKGYFTVQLIGGRIRLQARGFVGLIPLNDRVVIDVKPRVPVRNLPRVLRVSGYIPPYLGTERSYAAHPTWNDSLIDLFGEWLMARMEVIASGGLYREYQRREEASSFPRGRPLTGATIKRLWPRGLQHEVVATWFERTADNPANRCLKYAIWFLARRLALLGSRTATRRKLLQRLSALYELFASVPIDHSLSFLKNPLVLGAEPLPPQRHYYRPALDLAVTLVRQHAVDIEAGRRVLDLPSMVLNMETIFEAYLRNVVRMQVEQLDGNLQVLDGNGVGKKLLFDNHPSENATPDIVYKDAEAHQLVVEVKNIPVKGQSSRSALEQVITYAATYSCNRVVLVHPRSQHQVEHGLQLQGQIGDLSVYQYVFDLKSSDLVVEEKQFAEAMTDLCAG
jgi:5-methylcytosine-specific restriction enzyme subunit McrC